MTKKRWSTKLGVLMSGAMLALAGCQPVGSVDVGKAFSNMYAIQSSVSSGTVSLELTSDPNATLKAEDKKAIDLLNSLKINITESKQQDPRHASVKGTFTLSGQTIPFHLALSDLEYTLAIEGAKKPLVFTNNPLAGNDSLANPALTEALKKQMNEFTVNVVEAMPKLSSFFTGNFPNPKAITAESANVTVHGESLQLQKLHVELQGSELSGLIKGFLTSVLADEAGLKEFISTVYDLYVPLLKETMKAAAESADDASQSVEMINPYLENKTLAVDFIYSFLKTNLEKALENYDQTVTQPITSDGASLQKVLNQNHSLKMDLYLDADHFARKSTTELLLSLPNSSEQGVKSIKVKSESEVWNINKPVTIDSIDTSNGVINLAQSSGRMNASKLVASLDPNSALYKLLKDELKITKKSVNLNTAPEELPGFAVKPFNDNGTVMVPVRFVVEQLDADVEWNAETRQVTITDPLSGNVTVLTIDSTSASVNGKTVTLEKPAALVEGSTYLPVRFVAEEVMKAKVGWDPNTQTVSINRD